MNFPFEREVTLENQVAQLRPLEIADVINLLKVAHEDERLLQFSPAPIHSEELLTTYIENAIKDRLNKNRYPFIIFDKMKNGYAGSTSFLNIFKHRQKT